MPNHKSTVEVDHKAVELLVPDLGLTLRSLFAAAAEAHKITPKRTWGLRYSGALVGKITIKSPAKIIAKENCHAVQP